MDASALTTLVAAATEGMRKTQSADDVQDEASPAIQAAITEEGHQSDSAVAPTRERKKGASNFPGIFALTLLLFFFRFHLSKNPTSSFFPPVNLTSRAFANPFALASYAPPPSPAMVSRRCPVDGGRAPPFPAGPSEARKGACVFFPQNTRPLRRPTLRYNPLSPTRSSSTHALLVCAARPEQATTPHSESRLA